MDNKGTPLGMRAFVIINIALSIFAFLPVPFLLFALLWSFAESPIWTITRPIVIFYIVFYVLLGIFFYASLLLLKMKSLGRKLCIRLSIAFIVVAILLLPNSWHTISKAFEFFNQCAKMAHNTGGYQYRYQLLFQGLSIGILPLLYLIYNIVFLIYLNLKKVKILFENNSI